MTARTIEQKSKGKTHQVRSQKKLAFIIFHFYNFLKFFKFSLSQIIYIYIF